MKKATPEKHPLPRASLVWTAHAFTRATDNASVCTCKLKRRRRCICFERCGSYLELGCQWDNNGGAFTDTTHPEPCCRLTSIVVSVSVLLGKAKPNLSWQRNWNNSSIPFCMFSFIKGVFLWTKRHYATNTLQLHTIISLLSLCFLGPPKFCKWGEAEDVWGQRWEWP